MNSTVVCVAIVVILFLAAFFTKRRFGMLGLALAAGSTLSTIWAEDAGYVASMVGIRQSPFSTSMILVAITLLPAVILFFHGNIYKRKISRAVGALLFAVLALAFLVEPLGHMLVLSGQGADVYKILSNNQTTIIGIGLILAVIDLFLTKPALNLAEKHHKH